MLFSDDDAFIHPSRLLSDLAEHRATRRFVYGQIGWAAGWNPKQFSHFGYGNTGPEVHLFIPTRAPRAPCTRPVSLHAHPAPHQVFGRLYKDHLDAASEQGPYPYPYGCTAGSTVAPIWLHVKAQDRVSTLGCSQLPRGRRANDSLAIYTKQAS